LRKGRVIVYLSPQHGGFLASFALGEKAIAPAKSCKLPPKILKIISEAKRYAEGTAVRIQVTNKPDVAAVAKLAAIKRSS
jgi:hypothetical protein